MPATVEEVVAYQETTIPGGMELPAETYDSMPEAVMMPQPDTQEGPSGAAYDENAAAPVSLPLPPLDRVTNAPGSTRYVARKVA